jgi:ring-1,2-phenylacetyl-CoA epoxidase subunit PaaB
VTGYGMSDTQWPRFEVFQQERESRPHQNVGSVHAVDIETAIQNARDVFVRRPQALSLWVVPAEAIFSKTAQEIEADPAWLEAAGEPGEGAERYYVYQKSGQRRAMVFVTHVGEVMADSAEQALRRALQTFSHDDVYVWWVCPASAVAATDDDDIESMFAPAHDKAYRMPNQYRTITKMMEVRKDE